MDYTNGVAVILGRNKKRYPQRWNRCSNLDDPCMRRLYYHRVKAEMAEPFSDYGMGIMRTGTILEPIIEGILSEVGLASTPRWRVTARQTGVEDELFKKSLIGGTYDGLLQVDTDGNWKTVSVCDIKTCDPNIYRGINEYSDLIKYPWTRKWRGQLQLYALARNLDRCTIILCNKTNLYDFKMIEFPLDMDYAEGLIRKAEITNQSVAENKEPDQLNQPEECSKCPYKGFCAPDVITGKGFEIAVDEVAEILDRQKELEEPIRENKALDKRLEQLLEKGRNVMAGKWMIEWKEVVRKGYTVDTSTYFQKKIHELQ